MSTFTKYVRASLEQAEREAQSDRSTTIEAQHVILAIAAQPEAAAGQVSRSAGLDRAALREALNRAAGGLETPPVTESEQLQAAEAGVPWPLD